MAKIVLSDVASGYNRQRINENFQALEDELNNKVLYRDNPAGQANVMTNDLDMNSNDVLNAGTVAVQVITLDGVNYSTVLDGKVTQASNFADASEASSVDSAGYASNSAASAVISSDAAAATAGSVASASASASAASISAGLAATSALESSGFADASGASASASALSASAANASAILATSKASLADGSATDSAASAVESSNYATASSNSATASSNSATASQSSASASAGSAVASQASLDEFQSIYHGALSSVPTTNVSTGDLYFDIPSSSMRIYDGTLWRQVATSIEGVYAVTEYTGIAGQTTLAITYDIGLVQVLYNGVQLNLADFTATNGTSIVLAVAVASAADVITVIRWGAVGASTFLGTAATVNTGVTTGTLPFAEDVVLIQPSGNVGIGDASASSKLTVYDTASDEQIKLGYSSTYEWSLGRAAADGSLVIKGYNGASSTDVAHFNLNGNVGIGTSSPTAPLHTVSSENLVAKFSSSDVTSGIRIEDTTTSYDFYVDSGNLRINNTAGSEKMRLDSSGNLLVGKSAIGAASDGFEARANGFTAVSDTDNAALNVNRNGTDGALQYFYKAGTTVGSIGTFNADTYIGNGDVGIHFNASGDQILPINVSNVAYSNGFIDIGASTARFKNAYLSGGVVFGTPSGAATSNTLDDYEEGVWTPTVTRAASAPSTTYTRQLGAYTKIGNLVTLTFDCRFSAISGGSGSFLMGGLPFESLNTYAGGVVVEHSSGFQYPAGRTSLFLESAAGQTLMYFVCSGTSASSSAGLNITDHSGYVIGSITYQST